MVAPANSTPSTFTRLQTKLDVWFQGLANKSYRLAPKVAPNVNRTFYLVDPGADCDLVTICTSGGQAVLGLGQTIPKGAIFVGNGTSELQLLTNAGAADNGKTFVLDDTVPLGVKLAAGGGGGSGDVVGPSSATDRSLALYDGATGKLLKNGPALGTSGHFLKSGGAGADPAFAAITTADVSGVRNIAGGGTNNGSLGVNALGIYAGDGSKLIQVVGTAGQSFRVNAGGTAIEAYTPSGGGGGSGDVVGPGSSTNRAIALYADTTGKLIKDGPALGSAGQYLRSGGAGNDPAFATIASSELSDGSNLAKINAGNSWSAAQVPNATGTLDLGSTTAAWRDLFLRGSSSNYHQITATTPTGARVHTLPNANSNTVIPDTGAANNFLTAISPGGVISKAQPAFSNLSGVGTIAQGCTNNGSLGVNALGIYAGDGSKLIQVVGTAGQSWRVNAGGTAVEAYTPSGGGGAAFPGSGTAITADPAPAVANTTYAGTSTGGAFNWTLPALSSNRGSFFALWHAAGTNAISVTTTGGDTVGGLASGALQSTTPGNFIVVWGPPAGTNWAVM